MEKCLLLIFVKKPEPGKVKTRLAATLGDEKALQIYLQLLERTREITQPLSCTKVVYYTPEIVEKDIFDIKYYQKALQSEGDLGERMKEAFAVALSQGYKKVCIIGSDCYELDTDILENAFARLENNEVVIGPAKDGGYYLLGMRKLYTQLFHNKKWSTSAVLDDTLHDLNEANLNYFLLPKLTDVDEEKDLMTLLHSNKKA